VKPASRAAAAIFRLGRIKSALKSLRRMPAAQAERITAKIEQHARDPRSLANNVKALAGSPYIRLRVGDWRVIMDDRGTLLEVLEIGLLGDVHR
jgi:mRNA interferase RelE/StbE